MSVQDIAAAINGFDFPGAGQVRPITIETLTIGNDANGVPTYSGTGGVNYGGLSLSGTIVSDVNAGKFSVGSSVFQVYGANNYNQAGGTLVVKDITTGSDGETYAIGRFYGNVYYEYPSVETTFSSDVTYTPDTNDVYRDPSACFLAGTRIATPRGEIAIEELQVGDMVLTRSGRAMPVIWIGHQSVDCRLVTDTESAWPYLIRTSAIGPGVPSRDTYLSGGHMIALNCLEELLIPVSLVSNGATIEQVQADMVDYWHLELERHEIIIANSLLAESFRDVGNRFLFKKQSSSTHTRSNDRTVAEEACRPVMLEGAALVAIRDRLTTRARSLGWQIDERMPSLTAQMDGRAMHVDAMDENFTIHLHQSMGDLKLISPTFVPQNFSSYDGDKRHLGLRIKALRIWSESGESCDLMSEPRYLEGFSYAEQEDGARWTNGCGIISREAWSSFSGAVSLSITLDKQPHAMWQHKDQAQMPPD